MVKRVEPGDVGHGDAIFVTAEKLNRIAGADFALRAKPRNKIPCSGF